MEKPLTGTLRTDGEPLSLAEYERTGGYAALRKALREMSPQEVTAEVTDSGLRGRGGAGFPTGKKWSFVPMGDDAPRPKYLVCNADEMEPGTFKDRVLLEGNPHLVIEGMILASYAIGAETAFLFVRREYKKAARRMQRALSEAYQKGYLGRNVLDSGCGLEMHLHTSAGRYMCGEETGLLNALEGKRATPRAKPPYPGVCGLWGKPTVVNNVETLCNIPPIVERGAGWFRALSRTGDAGTKIFGVSGRARRPGWWELPMGTTAREIVFEHAGGMAEGFGLRAVIPGGGSTEFVLERDLDVPMDFDSLQAVGSRLGTGTMILLDDRTCPVGMVHNLETFFARESCGWCTPCRDGLPWVERILEALEDGRGEPEDLDLLSMHARFLGPGHTFCALAPGAMEPLQSALRHFRGEFESHIRDKRCPWR